MGAWRGRAAGRSWPCPKTSDRGLGSKRWLDLADLRFRQGRLEEAEALVADFGDVVAAALPAAAVRLARGEPAVAVGLLERNLNHLGERHIEAPPTLAMLVEAHIAAGDLAAATEAAERLSGLAQAQGRPYAAALAVLAAAHVSAARGDSDEAISLLERALARFSGLETGFEGGRMRAECPLGARRVESSPPAHNKGGLPRFSLLTHQCGAALI